MAHEATARAEAEVLSRIMAQAGGEVSIVGSRVVQLLALLRSEEGGIESLVRLSQPSHRLRIRRDAVKALSELSFNAHCRKRIMAVGGVALISRIAAESDPEIRGHAAVALSHLTYNHCGDSVDEEAHPPHLELDPTFNVAKSEKHNTEFEKQAKTKEEKQKTDDMEAAISNARENAKVAA